MDASPSWLQGPQVSHAKAMLDIKHGSERQSADEVEGNPEKSEREREKQKKS